MTAAAANLRAWRHDYCVKPPAKLCGECRRATAAADVLDAIDALHQPVTNRTKTRTVCISCDGDQGWPCATSRTLHAEEATHAQPAR